MANGGTPSAQPLGTIEPPGPMARMGRGAADWYEPLYSYLLANPDPEAVQGETDRQPYAQAQARYDAQRKADEALYLRGLLGATPAPGQSPPSDIWRTIGSQAVGAPLFATGLGGLSQLPRIEAAMSAMLTSNAYDALGALAQRFGSSNPPANTRPPGWTPELEAAYGAKNRGTTGR